MKTAGRIFNLLGLILIVLVLMLYLPITVPQLMGMGVHTIISGSMEPTIPVGSVVYSDTVDPDTLQPGDIIVFQVSGSDTPVTHRVTGLDSSTRCLTTKGDANLIDDLHAVSYSEVLGRVEFHLPLFGYVAPYFSSLSGKLSVAAILVAALILRLLGGSLLKNAQGSEDSGTTRDRKRLSPVLTVLIVILGCTAVYAGAMLASQYLVYQQGEASYTSLEEYVTVPETSITTLPKTEHPEQVPEGEASEEEPETYFPWEIQWPEVDFDSLREVNPDTVAWIYIEDTGINYPIVRGEDNDFYLHHNFEGKNSPFGCIFLDSRNSTNFNDLHCILYGHHMNNGSMFAGISQYKKQEYYDAHPLGLLITPERRYVIEFFSGYVSESVSSAWVVKYSSMDDYLSWLVETMNASIFDCDVEPGLSDQIITLSTCSYEFNDARFVIHGILHPEPEVPVTTSP